MSTPRPLARLRKLCLTLPEAHEVIAWGEPTFRVRNKMFAMFASANNHHGGGRPAVWIKSTPADQKMILKAAPDAVFKPPYVGPGGWIGVWLDGVADWDTIADFLHDGYRLAAPKRLLESLDNDV
jgi:predicted DNA-binding protein (MmcQ/YjbR family)